jgi:hypothetical protein
VNHDADLFQIPVAAVVPEQPFLAVEDGVRLVARVVVPSVCARNDDRIGRMALPVRDAILAASEADPRRGLILETDIK